MELIGREGRLIINLLEDPLAQVAQDVDLRVSVSAKAGAFVAEAPSVWLESLEQRAFLKELDQLNQLLKGKAEISAMSQNEFWLKLESLDLKGHIGVQFCLGRSSRTENGQFDNQMRGGFEVEPGAVKSLYEWLSKVIGMKLSNP